MPVHAGPRSVRKRPVRTGPGATPSSLGAWRARCRTAVSSRRHFSTTAVTSGSSSGGNRIPAGSPNGPAAIAGGGGIHSVTAAEASPHGLR